MFEIVRSFGIVGFLFGLLGIIVYTLFCLFLIRLKIMGYNGNEIKEEEVKK